MLQKFKAFLSRFTPKRKYGHVVCVSLEKKDNPEYIEAEKKADLMGMEVDKNIPRYIYSQVPFSFHLREVSSVTEMILNNDPNSSLAMVDLPARTVITNIAFNHLIEEWLDYTGDGFIDYIPRENNN
jgi:hypothetical protein